MTRLALNYLEAGAVAIVLYYLGLYIKTKFKFLRDYFIPAPVVGGLLFALLNFFFHELGILYITFDGTLQRFFMTLFFTSVGFAAKVTLMKKGGKQLLIMAALCAVFITLQNIIGVAGISLFGRSSLLGISVGSVALIGGHGTAGAFGPVIEELGGRGAAAASIAMATFGLIMGGLVGGPVASRLIAKNNLISAAEEHKQEESVVESIFRTNADTMLRAMALLLLCMGLGSTITTVVANLGIVVPGYLGGMLVAAFITNISKESREHFLYLPIKEINTLGSIGLTIFLSMALMSLSIWELIELAGPMAVIAVAEVLLICVFSYFVVFRAMGKDYEAAVISSAFCGFGLGATPTAMANMNAITAGNGPAPLAYILIPLTGSLIVDFSNASIITIFINLFK